MPILKADWEDVRLSPPTAPLTHYAVVTLNTTQPAPEAVWERLPTGSRVVGPALSGITVTQDGAAFDVSPAALRGAARIAE
eukprot:gene33991-61990_t